MAINFRIMLVGRITRLHTAILVFGTCLPRTARKRHYNAMQQLNENKKKNNAAEDNSPSSSWKMTQSPLAPTPPLPTHLTPSVRDTARNFLEFSTNTRSRRLENGNFAQKKNENWILFFFFFFFYNCL